MEAGTIVPRRHEALSLAYACLFCGGMMVPTKTIASEPSLTCCRCGHEVMASTRLFSCVLVSRAAR